jgi:hypothetical protein
VADFTKPQPRRCVFCGSEALTQEHVWPAWISNVLPAGLSYRISRTQTDPRTEETRQLGRDWSGDALDLKVKRVCGGCNSGWMSQLEEAAKPLLTPLILGEPVTTTADERRLLATWALLRVIMAEYTDPRQVAVPEAHRRWIFKERRPPRHGVYLWVAGYSGDDSAGLYRHAPIATHKDKWGRGFRPERVNAYGVTFGIYKVIFQVFGATTAPRGGGDLQQGGDLAASTSRIWPPTRGAAMLPVGKPLSPSQLDSFANVFARAVQ